MDTSTGCATDARYAPGSSPEKRTLIKACNRRSKILVLNDPARGIDVDTKRELYKYLREFVGEGNSVIYMSSELEEFIGFCSRVVVFRSGGIFDTFVDSDVEPVGILECMFGRVRQAGSQAARAPEETVTPFPMSEDEHPIQLPDRPILTGDDITHVKIVDFDEENKTSRRGRDKIKISYFD